MVLMHTYTISKVIDKTMYNNILNNTPHFFSTDKSTAIINNKLLPIPDDEKDALPSIYLYTVAERKNRNGKKVKIGQCFYMLEICINYTKLLGGTGFYSIPIENTKSIIHQSIIDLVCRAVPEIYKTNNDLHLLYYNLKLLYKDLYPNQPIPDIFNIADIVTVLAKSDDEAVQEYLKQHFLEPEIFTI